jgi:hypothetical protein
MTHTKTMTRNLAGRIAIPFEIAFAQGGRDPTTAERHPASLGDDSIEPNITSGCMVHYRSPPAGLMSCDIQHAREIGSTDERVLPRERGEGGEGESIRQGPHLPEELKRERRARPLTSGCSGRSPPCTAVSFWQQVSIFALATTTALGFAMIGSSSELGLPRYRGRNV